MRFGIKYIVFSVFTDNGKARFVPVFLDSVKQGLPVISLGSMRSYRNNALLVSGQVY